MSLYLPPPPKASEDLVRSILKRSGVPTPEEPVAILAVRGYRRDSMGQVGENDGGIWDDAMFLCAPELFRPVNANTDPSRYGWNSGAGKPMAVLRTGLHYFRRGPHKGKEPALRQCTDEEANNLGIPNDGEFPVLRCWKPGDHRNYIETGYFAINVHPGGVNGTSSEGCLTIPPSVAGDFLMDVWRASIRAKQHRIPILLVDGPIT